MPLVRISFLAVVTTWNLAAANGADAPTSSPASTIPSSRSVLRQALTGFSFKPPAAPAPESRPPILSSTSAVNDAPIELPVFRVNELAPRITRDLDEAHDQRRRLGSRALIKKEFNPLGFEAIFPPEIGTTGNRMPNDLPNPRTEPRFELPIIRF